MGIVDIIDFMRGTAVFSVSGMFPERFLNLCARSGADLRSVTRRGDRIIATVTAGSYASLLPLARKCHVKLKVKEKHGLPFILLPYRRRAGLLLGFPLFFGIIWLLSLFVWQVEMPELSPSANKAFAQAVAASGIRVGALRSGIDCTLAEKEISRELTDLSWVGISMNGSRVVIDARELEPPVTGEELKVPSNIIASDSGMITLVEPGAGHIEVEQGQAVAKGQLLISGMTELADGSVIMSHASGRVWAEVPLELESVIPLEQSVPVRTGRLVAIKRLSVLGLELPIGGGKPEGEAFEREVSEWQLTVHGSRLPLSVRSEDWYELTVETKYITPGEAEAVARAELERRLEAENARDIIETHYRTERTEDSVRVTLSAVVLKNIAQQREILFSE